ncbi:MAG: hypothetical protein V4669_06800 [Pseudomonadota bacterium]
MMSQTNRPLRPCDVPGKATLEAGVVLLDGPNGVAVAMTPACALQTADNLRRAAMAAANEPTRPEAPDS